MIEIDGQQSKWKQQQTGIRQGCPLSPYLFLIVMTVMFHDIHNDTQHQKDMGVDRILGAVFDEVLYADDTIIHSTDAKKVEKLLHRIEQEGGKYGLKLNKNKCETMNVRGISEVHLENHNKVKEMNESRYLGCFLNNKTNSRREINKRKGDVFATLKKLEEFWKNCNCSLEFKLIAYDAVIRAKLMYGLESLQLNKDIREDLNVFQRKGLRQILKHPQLMDK